MAAPKGNKFAGSRLGCPNKMTQGTREAYKLFVEGNLPKLQLWLDACEPDQALEFMLKFSEYFIPKLARIDHGNADGKAFEVNFTDEQASKILKLINGTK